MDIIWILTSSGCFVLGYIAGRHKGWWDGREAQIHRDREILGLPSLRRKQ